MRAPLGLLFGTVLVAVTACATGPAASPSVDVTGTVSGNEITLSLPASGYLTVTGNQMTGSVNGLNVAKLTLRNQ